jgi:hypothetical protein
MPLQTYGFGTDERLDGCKFVSISQSRRADGVPPDGCGHDERLGVVHLKRVKGMGWTLNDGAIPLDEIQHVDIAFRVVLDRACKPVTTRLDKLQRMKPRALLSPIWT